MTRHHPRFRISVFRDLFALMLLLCVSACTASDDGRLVTERDSAGVRIIEARRPVWNDSTGWRLDPEPLLDLTQSGTGDPHRFRAVRGMRWLSDGSIVVANTGTREIRQFSPDGDFVGSAGGDGEAPDQFFNIRGIELVGDSVYVRDSDNRLVVFAPGPTYVRTMHPRRAVEAIHSLGDGTLVAEVLKPYSSSAAAGVIRAPRPLLRLDPDGLLLDTISETAGWEQYTDNVSFTGASLFPKRSLIATRHGGIFYGPSDVMEVRELTPDGRILRILRIPDYPLTLSVEQVEAERSARQGLPVPGGPSLPTRFRRAVEAMPAPATRPAYSDLLVGPAGAIWLRPYVGMSEGGGPVAWIVLDADGTWLGDIEVPARFRIWDIGMDKILGTWIDNQGTQRPLVLRLNRDGETGSGEQGSSR